MKVTYKVVFFNNYFILLTALQANQVEVKFTIPSLRVEEDVGAPVELLAMRSGNTEIASIVRLEKIKTANTNNN